jgi:hypothetical protein
MDAFLRACVWGICALALFTVGLQSVAEGKDWYVRGGAVGSGNGTDWVDAWSDVNEIDWSAVTAGDSIWLAAGSYGTLTLGKSGLTNNLIYMARVRTTNAIATAAAGWNSAYDSTVTLNRVVCNSYSFWTLDGQLASGIIVNNDNVASSHGIYLSSGASYINLKGLLITGIATNQSMSGIGDTRCVNLNYATGPAGHGLYIGYCTLQQYPTLISTLNMSDMTVEHCLLRRNYAGNSGIHPNIWQVTGGTNIIFRYNEVTEQLTEGIMMDFVSTNDAPSDNWDIYGNVWHDAVPGSYSRIIETQYRAQYRIRLYNNTFVNVYYGVSTAGGSWGTGCMSMNNICFTANSQVEFGLGSDDYNISMGTTVGTHSISGASTNIFVNSANEDYHISSSIGSGFPRNKGINLGAHYSIDFSGNIRGSDGAWDIGAYEYVFGGNSAPTPPTGLRVSSP